ncbi:MAG: family 16 glycosylhydrolase [Nocardioidaceae bacterium]|nr:family 16 glycosylhydrolase [Nocardioidaceae bacterium]
MSAFRWPVRALAVAGAVVLAVTLLPAVSSSQEPGPIHAGNTYGWYRSDLWRQEFKGAKPAFWHKHGRGTVRTQHGMLTLNTTRRGSVSATLAKPGHRTGRWEIRLRSRRYETRHANYRVVTELIPAGTREQHCGARNIALENYRLGSDRAKFYIHTLPNNSFRAFKGRNLANDRWHTFAVEVTRNHISWFVDARVVRTERRQAALSGVPLTVRFTMKAVPGKVMNQSRMQMDWMRYWTTDTPNTRSIRAPRTDRSTFGKAC